jgi:hypothetical protein
MMAVARWGLQQQPISADDKQPPDQLKHHTCPQARPTP